MRWTLVLVALGALMLPRSSSALRKPRTFFLVGLPSLGTVGWACDKSADDRFSLTFHAFRASADDQVELSANGVVVRRAHVLPGHTVRFPSLASRVQRLRFVQGTEPGPLRAAVRVEFRRGATYAYCAPYLPPEIDVHVTPRR
jgi:hypothetical protein